MTKKILSIFTTLIMAVSLAGVLPAVDVAAAGGVKQKLDSFISTHPSGGRWTGSFDGGKQCYGFAKLVIYNIFGKSNSGGYTYRTWKYNGSPTSGMTVIGYIKNYSATNVKNLLSKAKCGDVLQFDQTKKHSMIVYKVESDGVVIYDCNWDYNCGIRKKKCSFGTWSGRNSNRLTLLRSDNYSKIDGTTHTINNSYGKNITAYLKSPTKKIPVYTSCGVIASGHYISGKDPVTIHEVYTDGCCKVSYKTDSGSTRTYLSKISYFNTHVHAYTKRLYEPVHPHRISERCSCGASRWTNEYYKLRTCEKCWDIKFNSNPASIKVKEGENASLSLSVKGSIYPETAKYNWKYNESIINVTRNGNDFIIKGKKAGSCNLVFTAYTDKSLSKIITKLSIPVNVSSHTHKYTSKITKQPTCTATGVKTFNCKICGKSYTETIKAIGHKWGTWKVTKEATVTSDGIKQRICSNCGNAETQIIPKKISPHLTFSTQEIMLDLFGENSQTVNITAEGDLPDKYSIEFICDSQVECEWGNWNGNKIPLSITGKSTGNNRVIINLYDLESYNSGKKEILYNSVIDVTVQCSHKYEKQIVNPTCTEQGYTEYKCSICGDVYNDDYIDAKGHNYQNGICIICWEKDLNYTEPTDSSSERLFYISDLSDNPNKPSSSNNNSTNPSQNPTNNPNKPNQTTTPTASPINKTKTTPSTTKVTAPKPTTVKSIKLTAKKKKLNVSWKKVSGATGYEIQYAMNNKFTKNKKSVTVKKNKITIKNLRAKKKYFVKVRAFKKVNGNTYYGNWSKVVKKKTK